MKTEEEVQDIMRKRGFSLHSKGISGTFISYIFLEYDYEKNIPITDAVSCIYNNKYDTFEFGFITRNNMKLVSNGFGSFDDDIHFDKWYTKFREEVNLLSYKRG